MPDVATNIMGAHSKIEHMMSRNFKLHHGCGYQVAFELYHM